MWFLLKNRRKNGKKAITSQAEERRKRTNYDFLPLGWEAIKMNYVSIDGELE